eukprot:gene6451-6221_t
MHALKEKVYDTKFHQGVTEVPPELLFLMFWTYRSSGTASANAKSSKHTLLESRFEYGTFSSSLDFSAQPHGVLLVHSISGGLFIFMSLLQHSLASRTALAK